MYVVEYWYNKETKLVFLAYVNKTTLPCRAYLDKIESLGLCTVQIVEKIWIPLHTYRVIDF